MATETDDCAGARGWIVACVFFTALFGLCIGGLLEESALKHQWQEGTGGMLLLLVGLVIGAGALAVGIVGWCKKAIPPGALSRFNAGEIEAALVERGPLTIPQDAVDRRWLVEIEDAFNAVGYWPIYDGGDLIVRAAEESNRSAQRLKVQSLISAALRARGQRLPPKPVYER